MTNRNNHQTRQRRETKVGVGPGRPAVILEAPNGMKTAKTWCKVLSPFSKISYKNQKHTKQKGGKM